MLLFVYKIDLNNNQQKYDILNPIQFNMFV